MPRIILIDGYSGYIWGDSADFYGAAFPCHEPMTMEDFALAYAEALDRSLGDDGFSYSMMRSASGEVGYHVHVAAGDFPAVRDGQSPKEIDAVMAGCPYIGFIERSRKPA